MAINIEQQEVLAREIKKKESQLKSRNLIIPSRELWHQTIAVIIEGGGFDEVLQMLESYPQDCLFVA